MEKVFHANGNQKKAGVTISDKTDLNKNCSIEDGHYIMIKVSIQQENKTFVNIFAPKYIKQILTDLKRGTDSNRIMGYLLPHIHRWIAHPDRKSINKHWS